MDSNFSDGTLFDTIIKINEKMSQKLKIKVDLRKEGVIDEDPCEADADRQKQLEEKLDKYVRNFINLNADNKHQLEIASKQLQAVFDQKLDVLDLKMKDNVQDMSKFAVMDAEKTKKYRNELEIYVNQIHTEVQKMEEKRMKDMDAQIGFIIKLKEENHQLRKNMIKQDAMCKEIKQYLA